MSDNNLHKLNKAINKMDMTQIDNLLESLENVCTTIPPIEDSILFAKRIIKNNSISEGTDTMKIISKKHLILTASIATLLVAGTSVLYATGLLTKTNVFRKDATYTISTDRPLTDEEANAIIDNLENTPKDDVEVKQADSFKREYNSLDEASKDLNIPLVMPSQIPESFTLSKSYQIETYEVSPGHSNTNVYINFDSPDFDPEADPHTQKIFSISVLKSDNTQESILETDVIYDHTYTNAQGDTYTIFSDEGGTIAQITLGDIDYVLCFMNISEDEIYNTIDHTDLSVYKN